MAFVVGFAKALQEKSERDYKDKTREEDRQYERDEWTRRFNAERRGAWEDTILKTALTSRGSTTSTSRGSDETAVNPEIYMRGLSAMGVSPEALTKLAETQNPALFKDAYESLNEQWLSYRDEAGDDPEAKQVFYTEVVSPMFNELVMTSPTESPLFKDGFKDQITQLYGGVLPENVSQALNTTTTTPGTALITPGLAPKIYSPAETQTLRAIEKERLLEVAVENLRNLQDEYAEISIKQTEGTSSEEEDARADQLLAITRGLAGDISAAKENGILGPLRSVFGTETREQLDSYFRDSGRAM